MAADRLPLCEKPHIRIRFCVPPGFFENLDPGFIRHEELAFQKFPVKAVIQWPEIIIRAADDPVGKDSVTLLGEFFKISSAEHAFS